MRNEKYEKVMPQSSVCPPNTGNVHHSEPDPSLYVLQTQIERSYLERSIKKLLFCSL